MILGFKQFFPWGEPTNFKEKILGKWERVSSCSPLRQIKKGTKLHTIREGNRWKPGMVIHMATGVRTKQYNQFNKGIPELSVVKSVQFIGIDPGEERVWIKEYIDNAWNFRQLSNEQIDLLAVNDGFKYPAQFWDFFDTPGDGQLIHWTDLKY